MARQARRPRTQEGRSRRPASAGLNRPASGNGAASDVPAAPPSRSTRVAPAPPPRSRGRIRRLLPRGAYEVWSELRKVTWPSIEDTRYLTIVVSIVAVSVGVFLGGVDLLFGWVIEQVFFT